MLKAIVFDFDGVLADSEPLHFRAFAEIGQSLGLELDYERYLTDLVGYDDRDALRVLLAEAGRGGNPAEVGEEIEALRARKQRIFERLVKAGVEPIPGALELVREAAERMPIAIASGATRLDIDLILEGLGCSEAFPVIVSADDVTRSKPAPESYAMAVQRLRERHPERGLEPGACLAIEDTQAGVASARAAGLWTLGVGTTGPTEALGADWVVDALPAVSVVELARWVEGEGVEIQNEE